VVAAAVVGGAAAVVGAAAEEVVEAGLAAGVEDAEDPASPREAVAQTPSPTSKTCPFGQFVDEVGVAPEEVVPAVKEAATQTPRSTSRTCPAGQPADDVVAVATEEAEGVVVTKPLAGVGVEVAALGPLLVVAPGSEVVAAPGAATKCGKAAKAKSCGRAEVTGKLTHAPRTASKLKPAAQLIDEDVAGAFTHTPKTASSDSPTPQAGEAEAAPRTEVALGAEMQAFKTESSCKPTAQEVSALDEAGAFTQIPSSGSRTPMEQLVV